MRLFRIWLAIAILRLAQRLQVTSERMLDRVEDELIQERVSKIRK